MKAERTLELDTGTLKVTAAPLELRHVLEAARHGAGSNPDGTRAAVSPHTAHG